MPGRIDSTLIYSLRGYERMLRNFGLFDAADFTRQLGDLMADDRYDCLVSQISPCQLPWSAADTASIDQRLLAHTPLWCRNVTQALRRYMAIGCARSQNYAKSRPLTLDPGRSGRKIDGEG